MIIVWDGAAIHRSEAVKAFLKERPSRVHLERLPAYSPELNPVELVWSQVKRSLKNQVFANLETLKKAVLDQVKILEKDPKLVEAFFHKKEIGFITT
jgi:transposase